MIKSQFDYLTKEILLQKYKDLGFWSKVAKDINVSEGFLIKIRKNLGIFYITKDWRFPKTRNQNQSENSLNFKKIITSAEIISLYEKFGSWSTLISNIKSHLPKFISHPIIPSLLPKEIINKENN